MTEHNLEVIDAELVDDHLPALRETAQALALPPADPDAWLPPEAEEDAKAGIADSTNTAYSRDFRDYVLWCQQVGRRPIPAAPQTVTHYISHLTRTPREKTGRPYSPSSLERIIASIRTTHSAAGHQPPETKAARKVLAGYRTRLSKANDPRSRPNKTSPALPAVLRTALSVVDRTTLKGKRDAAILLLGIACAARASELVSLDVASVTEPEEVVGVGIQVRVYRKKTHKWQNVTVKYGKDKDTCPVTAARVYLAALEAEGHTGGPLFLRIDRWGYLAAPVYRGGKQIGDPSGRLTGEAISDVVEKSMAAIGMAGRWRSHSLRRGFATAASMAGADPVHSARHGGWADNSTAYQGYVQEASGLGDENPLTNIGL